VILKKNFNDLYYNSPVYPKQGTQHLLRAWTEKNTNAINRGLLTLRIQIEIPFGNPGLNLRNHFLCRQPVKINWTSETPTLRRLMPKLFLFNIS